jgi:hypothetical protein
MAFLRRLSGERLLEISAIQRILKDHIKDATVRAVVAHQCAAAAKAARLEHFSKIIKKGDKDNGE